MLVICALLSILNIVMLPPLDVVKLTFWVNLEHLLNKSLMNSHHMVEKTKIFSDFTLKPANKQRMKLNSCNLELTLEPERTD